MARLDKGGLRRRGGGTATGTGMQSREGPCSEMAIIGMRNANNGGRAWTGA
jgi:hypothetical protein